MSKGLLFHFKLDSILDSFPQAKKMWIACSGGMDSCVLLHLIHSHKQKIKQNLELQVVYVNHGLQAEGAKWGEFCKAQSSAYDIPFLQLDISEALPKGISVEAWARDRRYSMIADVMQKDDLLLTAHHQDDQVETFFLQALRGVGPRGLASMPANKVFAKGYHVRPLLNFTRSELFLYANENDLIWNEDPSNSETRYDRNYLRHNILSDIEKQWPAYRKTITRLIKNQQETKTLLSEIGQVDLENTLSNDRCCLRLDKLKKLSLVRQKNLIYSWLHDRRLATPDSKHMNHIISDIVNSASESSPCVNWKDVEIRRYRNLLYICKRKKQELENNSQDWNISEPLYLMGEELVAKSSVGTGLSKEKLKGAKILIRYREGGEKIKPQNRSHSKTLKQLFQERAVLPWMRDSYPLIYVDDSLAAVPGLCIDENYIAKTNEESWELSWSGYTKAVQV